MMTDRDAENSVLFGKAYNGIGVAVNALYDVRGNGTTTARKLADKLEAIAKEVREAREKLED